MTTPRRPTAPAVKTLETRKRFSLAHKMPPPRGNYRWIYLWEWPIRAMHWIAVLCIVALVVTGFYIGRPYFMTGGEPSAHYLMGWVRFIHFAAAGLLVATAVVRTYWLFMGNRYERLAALFPVRPRDWVNLGRMIKFYLMIRPERAPHYLGHNPLQQMSYTAVYGVALVQVEGLVIALASWLLAIPLSVPMSLVLGRVFGGIMLPVAVRPVPLPSALVLWLAVCVVVSVLASAWPARKALRVPTAAALAYE